MFSTLSTFASREVKAVFNLANEHTMCFSSRLLNAAMFSSLLLGEVRREFFAFNIFGSFRGDLSVMKSSFRG